MSGTKVDIDIKTSSIEKLCEGLRNEVEVTVKSRKEEIFTLNSSFHLFYDSSFQKYQKHHFVMLLLSTTEQ